MPTNPADWLITIGLILLLFGHLYVAAKAVQVCLAPVGCWRCLTAFEVANVLAYAGVQAVGAFVLAGPIVAINIWAKYLNVKHQLEQEAGRDEAL